MGEKILYGLEAIELHNGWRIAAIGIMIVFVGLVMLSFVIAQLHKALSLWENPSQITSFFKKIKKPKDKIITLDFSLEQREIAKQFALLARTLKDNFSLPKLLHLAQVSGLKEPHSNLSKLLKANVIVPDGNGYFKWDKIFFKQIVLSPNDNLS